jgi:hypothetical protein
MTDEQALAIYEDMKRIYGEKLPDLGHEPIRFRYYYTLYKHFHRVNSQ